MTPMYRRCSEKFGIPSTLTTEYDRVAKFHCYQFNSRGCGVSSCLQLVINSLVANEYVYENHNLLLPFKKYIVIVSAKFPVSSATISVL